MSQTQDHTDDDDRRSARSARVARAVQIHIDDVRWLMNNKRGRRIVWHQLEAAMVFQQTFNTNAMQMAFAEGKRSTGLDLLAFVMSAAPDQYMTMTTENASHAIAKHDADNDHDR